MCRIVLLIFTVLTTMAAVGACGPRSLPATLAGLTLQPGRYVKESYFAPGFKPGEATYALTPFTASATGGTSAATFAKLFQEELLRAWEDQGLKLSPQENAYLLVGTIQSLSVRGERFRRMTGRMHAFLTVSGTITHKEQVVFAFRDRVVVSSPLAPGPPAPKEKELLLRQLGRETAHHLLNELLLHGDTAEAG